MEKISLKYRLVLYLLKKLTNKEVVNLSKALEFRKRFILLEETINKILEKNPPLQCVYNDYNMFLRIFGETKI